MKKKWNINLLKKTWKEFFEKKDHLFLLSKSLVPELDDNSLLWINSGISTLKKYFYGKLKPPYKKLVSIQRSLRTNDLENVGITSHHLSFFEMMGNFSINAYFKKEAIEMAYEFLFSVLNLDKSKIYITYFKDDKETFKLWKTLGINEKHLIAGNKKTNFWEIGIGPCGPDTEIYFDRGNSYDKRGLELIKKDVPNNRFIEIWNIVFSEFYHKGNGQYSQLYAKNIDTGAGLERMLMILENKKTVFETSAILPLIKEIKKISHDGRDKNLISFDDGEIKKTVFLIADHVRSIVATIYDGVKPSNTSRGYIIRHLIRRAYWAGKKIGISKNTFLHLLTKKTLMLIGLDINKEVKIKNIIKEEENTFAQILKTGKKELKRLIIKKKSQIDEKDVFNLYTSFGIPIEMIENIFKRENIQFDKNKLQLLLEEHTKKSKSNFFAKVKELSKNVHDLGKNISVFVSDKSYKEETAILYEQKVDSQFCYVFEKTPFYPSGGGQASDIGKINGIEIVNGFRDKYNNIWHCLDKPLESKKVKIEIDKNKRILTQKNHSATHLLVAALKKIISNSVKQMGSYHDSQRLRLDVNVDKEKIAKFRKEIEEKVNNFINAKYARKTTITSLEEAKKTNVVFLENETYPDLVTVVDFQISKELCMGTHVENTKEIEKFKIIAIRGIGKAMTRIEAITSNLTILAWEKMVKENLVGKIIKKYQALDIKVSEKELTTKNTKLLEKELEKINQKIREKNKKLNAQKIDFEEIKKLLTLENGKKIIRKEVSDPKIAKQLAILIREKFKEALIIISAKQEGKEYVVIASNKFNSVDELKSRYSKIKGGGNHKFAMGVIIQKNN